MKAAVLIPTALLAGLLAPAFAETALDYMPADSEFVAQLNVKEVLNSEAFNFVWTEVVGGQQWEQQINAFQTLTEVDLRQDIERIAISGRVEDDASIVLVVEGKLPIQKLTSLVQLSDTYKKVDFDGLTAHTWTDDGPKFVVELGPDRILFGNTESRVKESLQQAKNDRGGRGVADTLSISSEVDEATAWAYVSTSGNNEMAELNRVFGIESGLVILNVRGEDVSTKTSVKVADGDANRWVAFLEGMRAIVQLQREEPWIGELVQEFKVSKDETTNTVSLSFSMPIQEMVNTIEELEQLERRR